MRGMLSKSIVSGAVGDFATDVRRGLTKVGQKELPSKYLYDEIGSKLFEVISELPEYGLTRADERLLRAHSAEVVGRIPGEVILCELGSGSGRKTRWILEAFSRRRHTYYYPIEISPAALNICRRELADIESVEIVGLEREYLDGLLEVAARRQAGQRILVLFLGSTIGNFSPSADVQFLKEIRTILQEGDSLLLGTDLEKPVPQLIGAYDDPIGVSAAFNLNLLARINRELKGEFVLSRFEHLARFNTATRSIEMHLVSKQEQVVRIPGAGLTVALELGETIWTESSRKYAVSEVLQMASAASFRCEVQWLDQEWPFAESLLKAE
ncbi:MAG: L-histidine N(alpha)-methyltransferase [Acidobacteriia bacterium]|nr:L-histidine N(alpha)-methyltransferase [Terriglobia bacterium]